MFHDEGPAWILSIWRKHLAILEACTLISLPTHTFGKGFIIGELERSDLITIPTATQYFLCYCRVAFVQFRCLLILNITSKPAKSEVAQKFDFFFQRTQP